MSDRMVYTRSSARPIYIMASIWGLLGLAGIIVMLIAMADVPRQSYYLLIAAFGLLMVALAGALAMLLATNTRRPWGIDPNFGPYSVKVANANGNSIEEGLRHAVQLPDGKGYGRRQSDDKTVVQRVAAPGQPLPPVPTRPTWANEMISSRFNGEQPPRVLEEPTEPITEVPLDQLDLAPATPAPNYHNEQNGDVKT